MSQKEIPEKTIEIVAEYINSRNNKPYPEIPVVGHVNNSETPQIFEIIPFGEIDESISKFYAIDGSYNSQEFYNGLSVAIYTAGYICYSKGKQVRMNDSDDPIIMGKAYYPEQLLVTNEEHLFYMFDELIALEPVANLISFFGDEPSQLWGFGENARDIICSNLSKFLSFAQNILEWSLVFEIANRPEIAPGDFILKDGTLRSNDIKQKYLVQLGKYIHQKGIIIVGITKNSPIKMELSYKFKQIDNYLQYQLKPEYPFLIKEPIRQKLCCWFEVPESVLIQSYGGKRTTNIDYARKSITSGVGFGLFAVARLDYVEKLQNYDWLVVDINIFDAIPGISEKKLTREMGKLNLIFKELTRLTQEHYILGYPFPLVEVHNFVSLKKDFKDEIIKRVKFALYREQRMDNIDIENLFLDIHDRF